VSVIVVDKPRASPAVQSCLNSRRHTEMDVVYSLIRERRANNSTNGQLAVTACRPVLQDLLVRLLAVGAGVRLP